MLLFLLVCAEILLLRNIPLISPLLLLGAELMEAIAPREIGSKIIIRFMRRYYLSTWRPTIAPSERISDSLPRELRADFRGRAAKCLR